MTQDKLFAEICSRSYGKTFDDASKEWNLQEVYHLGPDTTPDAETCLCGHRPIKEVCVLGHKVPAEMAGCPDTREVQENEVIVGNCCVKKFFDLPSGKIFDALKKLESDPTKAVNEETLDYALERGWLLESVKEFYLDTMGKRASTEGNEKVIAARENVNRRLLSFFKKTRLECEPSQATLPQAEAACAAGRIREQDLHFFADMCAATTLSEGQKKYRDSLEERILQGLVGEEPDAKRPRIEKTDVGAAKFTPEQIEEAHKAGKINDWEKERYEDWRAFGQLSAKQLNIRTQIEEKVTRPARASFGGAAASSGAPAPSPTGANNEAGQKFSTAELEAAFSAKKINAWERDRMLEWQEKHSLSDKQKNIKDQIEKKMKR